MYLSLLASSWVIVALGLSKLVHLILGIYHRHVNARRLGCARAPTQPNKLPFGIEHVRRTLKNEKANLLPMDRIKWFDELEAHTFQHTVLGFKFYFTRDPTIIQTILATRFDDFALGDFRRATFKPLLGSGIFTQDGADWAHSRALLRPQFTRGQVSHLELQEAHVQDLIRVLPIGPLGWTEPVDLSTMFFHLTLDTASHFLFGKSVYSQRRGLHHQTSSEKEGEVGDDDSFANAFDTAQRHVVRRFKVQNQQWIAASSEFKNACRQAHEYVDRLIQNIFDAQPNRKQSKWDDNEERYVFLEALHAETQDPIAIRSHALNMLLAGRDTTASLLSWLFYMLSRHPPACRKLREVILAEFGMYDQPQQITFEKLKSCQYLQHCINETLRLFPPIPVNARVAARDTMLPHGGGPDRMAPIYIKKGEVVVYSVHCMHRREDLWGDDAEEFKPDRWAHCKPEWKFLPFNGGPRRCLGQQFALTEASYVTVRLLQRFDQLESLETGSTSDEPLSVVHSTPTGLKVRCHLAQG